MPMSLGEGIPTTLEECFERLKTLEGLDQFIKASEGETIQYHHGLGRTIRNEWLYSEDSPLKKLLVGLRLFHEDDMSSLILTSFHRHMNGKPLEIQEQVTKFHQHWSKLATPMEILKMRKRVGG